MLSHLSHPLFVHNLPRQPRVCSIPLLSRFYLSQLTNAAAMFRSLVLRATKVPRPIGYEVEEGARESLINAYKGILSTVKAIPETSAYRQNVEKVIQYRLNIVDSKMPTEDVEVKIGSGTVEELLFLAQEEESLVKDVLQHKPWEGDASKVSIELID